MNRNYKQQQPAKGTLKPDLLGSPFQAVAAAGETSFEEHCVISQTTAYWSLPVQ